MRCIFGQNEAWGLFMMERIRRSGLEAAQLWERNQHYALNIVLSGSGRIKYEGGLSQRLSAVSASASASVVEQFLHRLELNAGERLTLPEIAEQLGVGYATMRRQVLQATGVSPARCRIEMRIRKARQLLLSHDVQTTAYRLGYTDPFVFSKQFKEATGYAPSTYRQSFSE